MNLTSVQARDNYQLYLEFDDGTTGIVDCSPINETSVFHKFDDQKFFNQYRIVNNKIVRDDDLDMDAE
jgi:hypothetical protein